MYQLQQNSLVKDIEPQSDYVKVRLKVSSTLTETEERWQIKSSLGYWHDKPEDFLNALKKHCQVPKFPYSLKLQKERPYWEDSRTKLIKSMKVDLSELAESKLPTFRKDVADLLKLQRYATEKEMKEMQECLFLNYTAKSMKLMVETDNLSVVEFNSKIKKFKPKFDRLANKYAICNSYSDRYVEFIDEEVLMPFDDWLEENQEDLQQNYDDGNAEDGQSFEDYCQFVYEEMQPTIKKKFGDDGEEMEGDE